MLPRTQSYMRYHISLNYPLLPFTCSPSPVLGNPGILPSSRNILTTPLKNQSVIIWQPKSIPPSKHQIQEPLKIDKWAPQEGNTIGRILTSESSRMKSTSQA